MIKPEDLLVMRNLKSANGDINYHLALNAVFNDKMEAIIAQGLPIDELKTVQDRIMKDMKMHFLDYIYGDILETLRVSVEFIEMLKQVLSDDSVINLADFQEGMESVRDRCLFTIDGLLELEKADVAKKDVT